MHGYVLRYLLGGKAVEAEVVPTVHAFGAFACVLGAYFLLVPMREEAGLALGVDALPTLFTISLAATLAAAPLAASILSRGQHGRGHRRLFTSLACVLASLYVALSTVQPSQPRGAAAGAQGPPSLSPRRRSLYATFYVWLGIQNLSSTSALWALCADVFEPGPAARLFGLIGAGATAGQLVGSAAAVAAAQAGDVLRLAPAVTPPLFAGGGGGSSGTSGGGPPAALLLLSALLMLVAGHLATRLAAHAPHAATAPRAPYPAAALRAALPVSTCSATAHSAPLHKHTAHMHTHRKEPTGGGGAPGGMRGAALRTALACAAAASRLLEGAHLVLRSRYLLVVCLYMGLQYMSSSMLYFTRALVVSSSLHTASERNAYFGGINLAVAMATLLTQTLATGRILAWAGVHVTLSFGPVVALVGMAVITCSPHAELIAGVEVLRKVVSYSVSRPSREVLFTVVSRREKYHAKVFMDMAVQRCGDVAAAAMFQMLHVRLGLAVGSVTAVGFGVCAVWLTVARHLGLQYQARCSTAHQADGCIQADQGTKETV